MNTIIDTIVSLGGTCFYTGVPLRNKLLGHPDNTFEILVYGISQEELTDIVEKNPIIQGIGTFKCILGIQDLNTEIDFTINSIYENCITHKIYDPHNGLIDLKAGIIRISRKTLQQKPIKLIEGCRLTAELGFKLSLDTWFEFFDQARLAKFINGSEIKKELINILMLPMPSIAFKLLQETRILEAILPELASCENVIQSRRSGVKNVFEHIMYTLDAADNDLSIRLVMLFHDIAKPMTLELGEDGKIHFFHHELLGSRIAKQYLKFWDFDKDTIQKVSHLILYHMFDADPRLTDKSVRRLIKKVGKDLIYDLLKVRIADRLGTPNKISMKKIKVLKKKIDKELPNL